MLAIATLLALAASPPVRAASPVLHASATCAPAAKPGRIRCRAVLELPLDRVAATRIAWAELRVVGGHASVTPLRGRLGVFDAETREDSRVVWSFSVAASATGEYPMDVRMLATLEPKNGPQASLESTDQRLTVSVRVAADK